MNYQAVIFDLDGTLLDTIDDLMDSMNAVMAQIGAADHDRERAKQFVGDGLRNYVLRAMPAGLRGDEGLVDRCCERFRQEYAGRWQVKTRPYEGVPEMLDALSARGLPMAVLTNKPDEFAQVMVRKILSHWDFRVVRGVKADGVKKPDPAGALAIAAELGAEPAACLYVGDTNTDMRTAARAGMYAVGVTWGYRSAAELTENGADVLIDRPTALIGLLE